MTTVVFELLIITLTVKFAKPAKTCGFESAETLESLRLVASEGPTD